MTGLSVESVIGHAAQYISEKYQISLQTAKNFATTGLREDEIDEVLQRAMGGCYNISINENYNQTFNNAVGLVYKHVVKVVSYDASTGMVDCIDIQNNNTSCQYPLSSFVNIKSYSY